MSAAWGLPTRPCFPVGISSPSLQGLGFSVIKNPSLLSMGFGVRLEGPFSAAGVGWHFRPGPVSRTTPAGL